MPCPILTPANLNNGINNFLSHSRWRKDFHNLFYKNATAAIIGSGNLSSTSVGAYFNAHKYGATVWRDVVGELSFWKALRPFPIAQFTVHPSLPSLQTHYQILLPQTNGANQLPASNPPHPHIQNLFNAAMVLKPKSVVFASKCCHMLMPWEFPISDGKFSGTGLCQEKMLNALEEWDDLDQNLHRQISSMFKIHQNLDYWSYRHFILTAWDTLPATQQCHLIQILNNAINAAGMGPSWNQYPYRTRIPELCLA